MAHANVLPSGESMLRTGFLRSAHPMSPTGNERAASARLTRVLWVAIFALLWVPVGCTSEQGSAKPASNNPTIEKSGNPAPANSGNTTSERSPSANQESASRPFFVEYTKESGLDFVHFNGMSGEFYFCEIVGAGAAVFDYDNDGDMDVYFSQGAMLGGKPLSSAKFPPVNKNHSLDRLYRNDLIRADSNGKLVNSGRLSFVDVTEESGIRSTGYGMGLAVGDYDNDGDVDLYVSNYDDNQFFRNNGDGTFTDVTKQTATGERRWSTSAAFFDYDADGYLDLFVVNYVDFTTKQNKPCYSGTSARDYCGPLSFDSYPDRLFRNNRNGTFTDITAVSGVARAYGSGLGVVCADFDGDQFLDVFVANDGRDNQLWMNQKGKNFKNDAAFAGVAYNMEGVAEASMGVDAADFDGDADFDLFMTHLDDETNTFYANDGGAIFEDMSVRTGLGTPSRGFTGFGTSAIDFDNDGWLDILTVNGAVITIEEQARKGEPFPLRQTNQLFRNKGKGNFVEVTDHAGDVFDIAEVSRGAAFGDMDNDGDMDVFVLNNNGPARLLLNEVGSNNSWIRLQARDAEDRYDLLGTVIEVVLADGRKLVRRMRNESSYCCANDPRVLVGLSDSQAPVTVRLRYVGGGTEEWSDLAPRKHHKLLRGTGKKLQ